MDSLLHSVNSTSVPEKLIYSLLHKGILNDLAHNIPLKTIYRIPSGLSFQHLDNIDAGHLSKFFHALYPTVQSCRIVGFNAWILLYKLLYNWHG